MHSDGIRLGTTATSCNWGITAPFSLSLLSLGAGIADGLRYRFFSSWATATSGIWETTAPLYAFSTVLFDFLFHLYLATDILYPPFLILFSQKHHTHLFFLDALDRLFS